MSTWRHLYTIWSEIRYTVKTTPDGAPDASIVVFILIAVEQTKLHVLVVDETL
jgi:hypothetical protein